MPLTRWYSPKEAAAALSVSYDTLMRRIADGSAGVEAGHDLENLCEQLAIVKERGGR